MKGKLPLYCCLLLFLLSGCAGLVSKDINKAMEIQRSFSIDTEKAFDESKVIYMKELRCYTYRDDAKKKDRDTVLFDTAGKKISIREEAVEYVRSYYSGEKTISQGEKIAYYSTAAWVWPVGFIFGVAENIAMLPAIPYILHIKNKLQKESVEFYQEGQKLVEQNQYQEAREKYLQALLGASWLSNNSDIFFRIAETYDKEGNVVLSEKYYKSFLEHSIALYPDYFQEYNTKLVDDRSLLNKAFTTAEEKLSKALTRRSGPAL